ncbi:hypothetical protein ADUPG1_010598 [Aduncisulcus paluster]|uniref:DDE Tnp4 domain-containing protein n=1 Tax=Aduncisulcus paluster TaxID=2918883 RepID=A0ABQ5JSL8_9EUKA|nr:hypothetical protein ADUPG1_010598 [Aduncisulcus paluster]
MARAIENLATKLDTVSSVKPSVTLEDHKPNPSAAESAKEESSLQFDVLLSSSDVIDDEKSQTKVKIISDTGTRTRDQPVEPKINFSIVHSGYPASLHDKRLFDLTAGEISPYFMGYQMLGDSAYEGCQRGPNPVDMLVSLHSATSEAERTEFHQRSQDRLIVEQYFGRLKSVWKILQGRYGFGGDTYADLFVLCCSLTNMLVTRQPLRKMDATKYRLFMTRQWYDLGGSASGEDASGVSGGSSPSLLSQTNSSP